MFPRFLWVKYKDSHGEWLIISLSYTCMNDCIGIRQTQISTRHLSLSIQIVPIKPCISINWDRCCASATNTNMGAFANTIASMEFFTFVVQLFTMVVFMEPSTVVTKGRGMMLAVVLLSLMTLNSVILTVKLLRKIVRESREATRWEFGVDTLYYDSLPQWKAREVETFQHPDIPPHVLRYLQS